MVAGDVCTVHAGTYREWVRPRRGGTSDATRITYRAAPGEDVTLKGSEKITSWVKAGAMWKAVVPNTMFGSENPYVETIRGDYLNYGGNTHLGEVYLDGEPYAEVSSFNDLGAKPKTWLAQPDAKNTEIWANFGADDPNHALAEINVRRYAFFPTVIGLRYITVEGFHVMHGATQWAPPTAHPQDGLVGTNWGFAWTIQDNVISDSKTVCVSGGLGTSEGSEDITRVGHHLIRNNVIRRCGEAGVAGSHGMVASVIDGNLVEDINPARLFGGYETAGIKIHSAVDVVISNNVIRNVFNGGNGLHQGIWLDWQSQGSRITGNLIYGVSQSVLDLEMGHGPTLVDDNIFVGGSILDVSENTIFAHDLFVDTDFSFQAKDDRVATYFAPHTTEAAGKAAHASAENRYYDNVFVHKGTNGITQAPGYSSDYNVFYGGAEKSSWGDAHSAVVKGFDAAFGIVDHERGAVVSWRTNGAVKTVAGPLVTRDFIGVNPVTKQGIEQHDGTPITLSKDITGASRNPTHPSAGPLEVGAAANKVTFAVGPYRSSATRSTTERAAHAAHGAAKH
jgi:alpha-N-arabinofuranosidase